jgi:PKD repeat protein
MKKYSKLSLKKWHIYLTFCFILFTSSKLSSQILTAWSEGFEGSMAAYSYGSYCGDVICNWADKTCKSFSGSYSLHSASYGSSCTSNTCSSYPNNLCNWFKVTNPIDISCYTDRTFSFRIWREMGSNDIVVLNVKYNSGSWQTIAEYAGSDKSWAYKSFSIPSYANNMEWQFDFITNDIGYSEDGAFIDDMKITGTPIVPSSFILVATQNTCGQAEIQWTDASGATKYIIKRDGSTIATVGSGTTSYTDDNLSAGIYQYCVKAINDCSHDYGIQVCIDAQVISNSTAPTNASASPSNICSGNSTTISKSGGSLGTGASWKWYKGSCGGTYVGTGASITVSPKSTTTYYVRAEGDCGNTTCKSVTVTVNSSPSAPSSVTASDGTYCDKVAISWSSVSGATSYELWYDEGGSTGFITSTSSTSYNYASASTSSVEYRVYAANSCGSSSPSYGSDYGYKNSIPSAPSSVEATDGTYCDRVEITWNSVAGATYYTVKRGSTTLTNSTTSTSYSDYNGTEGTTYTYQVYANNSCGQSSSTSNTGYRQCGSAPVANFYANPISGDAFLSVSFYDQSTNDPTSWSWNFGDGNTSTQQSPKHTYTNAGTYTVTLSVSNSYGSDSESKTDYITVIQPGVAPIADFSASTTSGAAPLTVAFFDSSSNSPTSWSWNFGDGTTDTQQNPSHTYYSDGAYTVTLTANNLYGSDSEIKTSYIQVGPNSFGNISTLKNFTIYPNPVDDHLQIELEIIIPIDYQLSMINSAGKQVYEETYKNEYGRIKNMIDLKDLTLGIYILKFETSEGIFTRQVIVK